jgi:competence protein ComFC
LQAAKNQSQSYLESKYREIYFLTHLADWLVRAAREHIDWREVDLVVPVPLHSRKKREREFNQAELLAMALRKILGVAVDQMNLRRVRDTGTQTALSAEERHRNLQGAFVVRRADAFKGKQLVVLDDVFTTGATMNACAKTLREAGATNVIALAVARGV